MRNILRLFIEDLKSLHGNLIAWIVIVGLAMTPALYAWFNTLGFWDPYSHTGQIEVAVANDDVGYESDLLPERIDAGDEVVSSLRADDQFKWTFVSSQEATEGVRSGRYYAALVIPSDFSEKLMTVFSTHATPATIVYYTNQKENAIAPRLTDQGATTLSAAIDADFTKAVTEVALSTSSNLMSFMNGQGFSSYTETLINRLDQTISGLRASADETRSFATLVGSCASLISLNGTALQDGAAVTDSTGPLLTEAGDAVTAGQTALTDASAAAESALSEAYAKLDRLEQALNEAKAHLPNAGDQPDASADALAQARAELDALRTAFQEDLAGLTENLHQSLSTAADTASSLAESVRSQSQSLSAIGDKLAASLQTTASSLSASADSLNASADELTDARDRLAQAQASGDWEEVGRIIGTDPDRIASFIAAPTKLDRIPVFEVADNGSAMSPFYTSLSIWIGAIFMVALMRTTVAQRRLDTLKNPKPHQVYLGRYLIFGALSLVQATIVGLGNLWFLGIQCVHPLLYMVTCWVAALVFSNLVYTLTVSFGRVGEAVAVILLVLQVGGSGGIFPVAMSAELFQVIYPFLPFTHSMEAFQSCIAGIYGMQYVQSLGWLIALLGPSLLLGLVLRRPVIKLLNAVTEKIESTRLFISE